MTRLAAMTGNAALDTYRYVIRKKQDGHKLSVYDGKKLIGVVGAITRGCDLPGYASHASVVAAEILPEYRGQKLYQEMLLRLNKYVKERGCKGLVSKGFQRSAMATRAWSRLNPRIERDPMEPYREGPGMDGEYHRKNLYLDGLSSFISQFGRR